MDSVQLGIGDTSPEDTSSEQSLSLDSSDSSDVCGEALVHPRVGEDHQVEIPTMLTVNDHAQLLRSPDHSEVQRDRSHLFLIGRSVPVMWMSMESDATEVESIRRSRSDGRCTGSENVEKRRTFVNEKADVYSQNNVRDHKYERKGFFPVPDMPSESWSDFEVDCFILGLYIFGKNLLRVKEFMETKEIGQILSFYYGKFYRSYAYSRWSSIRKMRNKKCILGDKLFSGCRLQELFSRLTPLLSKEDENSLFEISKSFAEERSSLEDYISCLKALVGIKTLVEAVGIGKSNDLTNLVVESSRSSHMFSSRPEMPFGKACSSLSTSDVIKFLTGDFRLSKARSNDLFWEAVWPRLLANGWHSELPRNGSYTSSKGYLVFLVPGIKKFRRKLVKGQHYFDSVSDVLKKVASSPELLETDVAEEPRPAGCSSKEENGYAAELNSDGSRTSEDELPRFLQPRTSTSIASVMTFVVVDSTIDTEEHHSKIRELKTLPAEIKPSSFLTSHSTRGNTTATCPPGTAVAKSENMDVLANSLDNSISPKDNTGLSNGGSNVASKRKKPVENHPDTSLPAEGQTRDVHQVSAEGQTKDINKVSAEGQTKDINKFSRRPKLVLGGASITKRRRLTACRKDDTSNFQIIAPLELAGTTCVLGLPAPKSNVRSHSQKNALHSVTSSAASTPENSTSSQRKQSASLSRVHSEKSQKEITVKPEVPELFDLNLPQVPPDEPNSFEQPKMEQQPSEISERSDALATAGQSQKSGDGTSSEQVQQPTVGGRRQSTRTRPLSTKAWEALEVGWMDTRPIKKQRSHYTGHQEQNTRPVGRNKGNGSSNCSGGDTTTDSEERLSNAISEDTTMRISLGQNEGVVARKATENSQVKGHPGDEKSPRVGGFHL